MKVEFKYSHEYECKKLVFMLSKIKSGFFQANGFIASNVPLKEQALIVVPEYPILKTQSFWKIFDKVFAEDSSYRSFDVGKLPELWKAVKKEAPLDINKIKDEWRKIEKSFFDIYNQFINHQNRIKKVTVYLTKYGTSSSYNSTNGDLAILLRQDQSIDQIAYCILAGLFSLTVSPVDHIVKIQNSYTWPEKQRVIDYLMTKTSFSKLFPNFVPLLDDIRHSHHDAKVLSTSNSIYNELGFPSKIDLIIKNDIPLYCGIELSSFSKSEKNVLKLLLQKNGTIANYDEIANEIWGIEAEIFYSPNAILKVIERIRKGLKQNGIYKEIIHSKRKLGYFLEV